MLSRGTKTLIKNHIRHVDTHNRMVEEAEMWRQKEHVNSGEGSKYSFLQDRRVDMKNEFPTSRDRRAHMDDEKDGPKETYWTKQLQKTEAADPDRWGHSGYKEMYPEEFYSDDSRHKKHRSKKRKKEKKAKKSKKKKKHKKHSSPNSETDNRKSNVTTKLKSPSKRKASDLSLMEKFTKLDSDTAPACQYIGVFKTQDPDKCKFPRNNSTTEKNRRSRSRRDKRRSNELTNITSSEEIGSGYNQRSNKKAYRESDSECEENILKQSKKRYEMKRCQRSWSSSDESDADYDKYCNRRHKVRKRSDETCSPNSDNGFGLCRNSSDKSKFKRSKKRSRSPESKESETEIVKHRKMDSSSSSEPDSSDSGKYSQRHKRKKRKHKNRRY